MQTQSERKNRTEKKRKEKTTKQKKTNENNLHAPPCRHAYAQAKLLYKLGLVLQGKHMLRKLSGSSFTMMCLLVSRKPVLHAGLGSTSTRLSDHLGTLSAVVILNSQWGPDSLYCCPFFCCPSNCSLHCLPCRHSLKERTEQKRKEKKRQQNKRKQMKITSMHRHAGMHMHRPSCCTSWGLGIARQAHAQKAVSKQLHNDVPPVSRKPVLQCWLGLN